jgi:hypothetical protein
MELVLLIIVIIVVSVVLSRYDSFRKRCRNEKRQTEGQQFIQKATPIVCECYRRMEKDIKERYPLVPIRFPSEEEILENLNEILKRPSERKKDTGSNSAGVYSDYFDKWRWEEDFQAYVIPEEVWKRIVHSPSEAIGQATKKVLGSLIKRAKDDFIGYRPDMIVTSYVPREMESEEFWASEERLRITKNGRTPPDWDERRRIVHQRDGQQCQRCGLTVSLEECHIHHMKRRSEGGDHSLQNLVTLCRSCHQLMEGHKGMKAIRPYYLTGRKTLHTRRCYHSRGAKKVWGSVPRLLEKGFTPCKRCKPWETYFDALEKWKPDIESYVEERLSSIIETMTTGKV